MITEYVEQERNRLVEIIGDLVRIPSENLPPGGAERLCQEYVARFLERAGWAVDMYSLDDVPGLKEHPLFWKGRDYAGRPNVAGRRRGTGGGRSLLLSGHIDTVPRGAGTWTRPPFAGEVQGGRLYGRGALDMKAGIATALFLAEAFERLGEAFAGDLLIESVVDEEFGGVNGTLAGRLRGHNADAAVIGEPTGLRVIPAQRGGRVAHLTFTAPGDIFADEQGGVADQLRCCLDALPAFAARRAAHAPRNPYYDHLDNRVPVSVTRIFTAPWGFTEPITTPLSCKVELYWQAAPGERQADIDREFTDWLDGVVQSHSSLFPVKPDVVFPIRWLPGSFISPAEPLVAELAACAREVLGGEPAVEGLEAPCDMFVFHQMEIPAVLWGPRGANAHAPDEYVDIDSVVEAAKVLGAFICRWCGMRSGRLDAV